ncbi:pyridoxamine 5'-phosphate oxidase family protein [Luteipulveratus mongoliensis]|uniref:pyridoxamine 5'-phosphate oxidase family protein n=1 Tax=Luteipulveratus mongoliensis TaxID=571913 RepID=UPI0006990826|nr:pyridoxamine 5'-phosphate oxidase family protein [Luteipulveratus mongoliensis]
MLLRTDTSPVRSGPFATLIPVEYQAFLALPRIASLGLQLADGRQHLTPVKATYDEGRRAAYVIVDRQSVKARRLTVEPSRVAIGEHDQSQWITLEGRARLSLEPETLDRARTLYRRRFDRPSRWGDAVVALDIDRVLTGR